MIKVWVIAVFKQESIDKINRVAFDYISAIEETGIATAYIIPCNTNNIDQYIKDLDAFIIPWWDDIDPSLYNESVQWSHDFVKKNDEFLLKFIDKIQQSDKLLFGICKWHQLINVFFWGTLLQDIPEKKFHYQYEKQEEVIHNVCLEKDNILFDIYGESSIPVNSIHHQVINELWDGLRVIWKSDDGYIEAIQHDTKNLLWVQWHPENLKSDKKLFSALFSKYIKDGKI